jgi:hypothetical protein
VRQVEPAASVWRWRTLPVLMAFTGGIVFAWYVFLISSGVEPGTLATWVFYVALFGFAIGLSQMTTKMMARRQWMKRARAAQAQERPPRAVKKPQTPA